MIDRAWRAIGPGVEVLSGDDGGPLRRTVKRILDPLVLRLRSNTQFSAPFVAAEVAEAMHDVIVGHAAQLRAAAAWFELLKRERRRLRITSGNAQELYFPVCFELAVTKGPPAQPDSGAAEAVLRDIHGDRDRTAIEVLNTYASDGLVIAELSDQLRSSWRDVRAGTEITGPFLAGLTTVLGAADTHGAAAARQRVWQALIADVTPYNLGAAAHHDAARSCRGRSCDLGLSSVEPQHPPAVIGGSDSERPLNRSVVDRVRATLRRAMDRDELPDIPMLCEEEVDRCCAPWGLLAEDKQATLVAGIEVAVDLAPLSETATTRYDLARQIQARLRKEAYVLHARRYLAEGGPIHPRQQQVIDDLAAFARPVPEPAVGAAARPRRLAGAMRRRRRCSGAAGGRGAVGEPRPPAAHQDHAGTAGGRMKLMSDSGLWSTGPPVAPSPLQRRARSQRRGAVVDRRRSRRRSPDHVHRPGPGGLAVAGARRGRAPCGRLGGRSAPHPKKRTPSIWPASTCFPDRWTRCGGWPSAIGSGGGGRRASETGSRRSTRRCWTRRSRC